MTKVILIVDDEPANIDLIKGLVPFEYKCRAAIKGEIALKQLAKAKPDMVILDLVMPGMDGFEVLGNIRANYSSKELPVLIVSGTKEAEDEARLQGMGISGFMTKPLDAVAFNQQLNTLLSEN